MNPVPGDFAVLMSDFLARIGGASDPAADGIEFAAEDCIVRAIPHPARSGHLLIEIEIGCLDFEALAENASALLALHRFNAASDWLFVFDADDVPLLRLVRPIAETDGAMLERLFADGIETALAAVFLADRREAAAAEARFPGTEIGIIRG
jgi:hypothetical protein